MSEITPILGISRCIRARLHIERDERNEFLCVL